MNYISTRDKSVSLTGAQAILQGLSRDGGLLVPDAFPTLELEEIGQLAPLTYPQRAAQIMSLFLEDFSKNELIKFAQAAYGPAKFDGGDAAPLLQVGDTFFLELWHGPTSAFKDIALQMLPRFLSASLEKTGETRDVCILVATSGDTGKAALEGFRDVPRTKIVVFYPRDGVSDVQKLQMMTQEGGNVAVCSVVGNFDDAQTGVKQIFSDTAFRDSLDAGGYFLSSANSINWGRLLPQIVYYFSSYCDLVNSEIIEPGEEINFCVPTGNFGNILAGYYAKKMGLPIKKLICASNSNNVLTDFIRTGTYDRRREFFTTTSPSMDILVSSNLERLLFDLSGGDDKLVAGYMNALNTDGVYTVSPEILAQLQSLFDCGMINDPLTKQTIGRVFREQGYLMDTHTAVAYGVYDEYRAATGDKTPTVVVSTASPFKFADAVIEALGGNADGGGFELIDALETLGGVSAPVPLKSLRGKQIRFDAVTDKDKMLGVVREFLV
ncbi:MAG: threonine synthase [Oscillospiraceae bacterium]|jgi:threonine synthase|nr:threonine synthase [Oscillospiraceae bacterium]